MKSTILLIPLLLSGAVFASAQSIGPSAINAATKTATIGGNEFEWSVGEMTMVSTFTASSVVITQGTLQPAVQLKDHAGVAVTTLQDKVRVYPNPASTVVHIDYAAQAPGMLRYELMDAQGKIVTSQAMNVTAGAVTHQVNIAALPCATYMLKILVDADQQTEQSMTYKIQKIK